MTNERQQRRRAYTRSHFFRHFLPFCGGEWRAPELRYICGHGALEHQAVGDGLMRDGLHSWGAKLAQRKKENVLKRFAGKAAHALHSQRSWYRQHKQRLQTAAQRIISTAASRLSQQQRRSTTRLHDSLLAEQHQCNVDEHEEVAARQRDAGGNAKMVCTTAHSRQALTARRMWRNPTFELQGHCWCAR